MANHALNFRTVDLQEAYAAAHQGTIMVDRSMLGMLKFTGETRLDLINRMSTQQVLNLTSGEGAATVLTNEIGRIIDRIILYTSRDSVYCLTGENNGLEIASYLRRFVFFMDDFQVEDLSDDTAILAVYGREADRVMADLFGEAASIPLHHWRQLPFGPVTAYLHKTDPVAGGGYFLMCQEADRAPLLESLLAADITPVGEEAFDYIRIESGHPRFGRELTLDYIPLEAGLWEDVSFNKGCYTGQEIIARLESRGRLAKRLTRLRPTAPLQAGIELTSNGRAAGTVTSAGDGPAGPLAMGYVKTAVLDEDAPFLAGDVIVTPL